MAGAPLGHLYPPNVGLSQPSHSAQKRSSEKTRTESANLFLLGFYLKSKQTSKLTCQRFNIKKTHMKILISNSYEIASWSLAGMLSVLCPLFFKRLGLPLSFLYSLQRLFLWMLGSV